MESGLAEVAAQSNCAFAAEVVKTNQWVYGMMRTASVCVMQKKVRDAKEPPPADFREQIVGANTFVRQGDLFVLGDSHVAGAPIYGILIHTTENNSFIDEGYGRAASIRLAFAFGDYSGWAAKFSLLDLIAAYPVPAAKPARSKPSPTWKAPGEEKKRGSPDGGG